MKFDVEGFTLWNSKRVDSNRGEGLVISPSGRWQKQSYLQNHETHATDCAYEDLKRARAQY